MRSLVTRAALALALAVPHLARAEGPASSCPAGCFPVAAPVRDGFTLTPYLWLPGITGTVGTGTPDPAAEPAPIEVDITKYKEGLRLGGAMVNLGWRRGPWSAWGDWTYANVRTEAPSFSQTLVESVQVGVVGSIVQAFGGYTALRGDGGHLDVGAGARGYGLYVWASLDGGLLGGKRASGDDQWVDAVGVVRGGWSYENGWELAFQADAGAGGSKLSWQVIGVAGYRFGWGALFGGWRYLSLDHAKGDLVIDIALSGGIFGARFAF